MEKRDAGAAPALAECCHVVRDDCRDVAELPPFAAIEDARDTAVWSATGGASSKKEEDEEDEDDDGLIGAESSFAVRPVPLPLPSSS